MFLLSSFHTGKIDMGGPLASLPLSAFLPHTHVDAGRRESNKPGS